jgi:hypothetical protein
MTTPTAYGPIDDAALERREYDLPHHYDWIERFVGLVKQAVQLAEKPQTLPPLPLPAPPPAPHELPPRIKLSEPGWLWPLERARDGRPPVISDGFHPKGDMRFREGVGHRGCDLMFLKAKVSPKGAPLNHPWESRMFEVPPVHHARACAPGRVTVSKWLSTGYCVAIDHGFGVETACHHLSAVLVEKGREVAAGDVIGIVGGPPAACNGGKPGLVHLHFDLLIGGKFRDPEPYVKSWATVAARSAANPLPVA